MAGLIRSLFKGKKTRKDSKEPDNREDYIVFQPCPSFKQPRQPTARFSDDCMLPATAAYHVSGAPKLRKGPQSCPGGNRNDPHLRTRSLSRKPSYRRQDFDIDSGFERNRQKAPMKPGRSRCSLYDPRSEEDDSTDENDRIEMFERKSEYYMKKFEESERQRREERRRQERLEHERNSIQSAMSNMAYCTSVQQMASVKQMEQLKKERDQFRKELGRYKTKYEKLENRYEQLGTSQNTPLFGGPGGAFKTQFQPPAQFLTPQFPASSHTFAYPNPPNFKPLSSGGPPSLHHRSMDAFIDIKPPRHQPFQNLLTSSDGSTRSFETMSHTPTTIGSDGGGGGGAGEALVNPMDLSFLGNSSSLEGNVHFLGSAHNDDEDEIKNYRYDDAFLASSPLSQLTQYTTNTTSNTHNTQ
ncbi:hypothetical protein L3Y34_007309 [Caenorhabditis briggsae]|uniref:Uncharacterized protein n=1 Tax=Caenorhabditis briggsae TaxID=6238 RepID=A0AAE9A3N8_CAEBR|nr:hypothetical protein L3Y34_007309 [Caenorhabditis briggsae]